MDAIKKKMLAMRSDANSSGTKAAELETKVAEKDEELKTREEEINQLQAKVKEMERDLDEVQTQLTEKQTQYDDFDKRVQDAEAQKAAMNRRIQLVEEDLSQLKVRLDAVTPRLDEAIALAEESETQRKALESRSIADDEKISMLEEQLKEVRYLSEDSERKYDEIARKMMVAEGDLERVDQRASASEWKSSSKMKSLQKSDFIKIPSGVDVALKSRVVTVKGPRGSLSRSFKHLNVDMQIEGQKSKKIIVSVYFASRKQIACIRTVISHIRNMITGVTKGYEYKMRLVYAHFPINVTTTNEGKEIEIRNYLGEKVIRRVKMLEGVKVERSEKVKDELVLTGNNLELVSQSAAQIQQSTRVPVKDIRKFLDGIYVSERNVLGED